MSQGLGYFELATVFISICYGSTMNAGFVGSFYVDPTLKKKSTAYLAALGSLDLWVTIIVMPICAIVMIQVQNLAENVCNILQLFTEISTNSYSLLTMLVATDNYLRAHPGHRLKSVFKSIPTSIVISLIILISTLIEIVGIYSKLIYNFCNTEENGDIYFRIAVNIFVHFIPAVFSLLALVSAARKARTSIRELRVRKLPLEDKLHHDIIDLNIITYVLYIVCWIPYLFTIYFNPGVDGIFYNYILWLGLIRSAVGNSLYIIFNNSFRRGFAYIFKFFCCPTALGFVIHPPQEIPSVEMSTHVIRLQRIEESLEEDEEYL